MTAKHGTITWFEIPSDNPAAAGKFYTELFDWQLSDMGDGALAFQSAPSDENMIPLEPGTINGDISPRSEEFDRPHVIVTVDSIDTALEKAVAFGGSVIKSRTDLPEMGMIWGIVADSEGNRIGIAEMLG